MKQCSKCKEFKDENTFYKSRSNKDGRQGTCISCSKLYAIINKEKIKLHRQKYYVLNKDRITDNCKKYRDNNKDSVNYYRKQYNLSNRTEMNNISKIHDSNIAVFETYKDKLTIEESPRLANDGVSLEIKCKYCGKYFMPTNLLVHRIIQTLNGTKEGTSRAYCSKKCQNLCPVFNQKKYSKELSPTSSREVDPLLRKMCFELDEWECQRCGKTESLICHHILGYTQYKTLGNDIVNTITFCEECHKWVHSFKGCRFVDLRCKLEV